MGMKVKPASRLTSIGPGTLTSHTVDPPAPAPVERVTQRSRAAVRARVCTQECLRANLANAAPTGPDSAQTVWCRVPSLGRRFPPRSHAHFVPWEDQWGQRRCQDVPDVKPVGDEPDSNGHPTGRGPSSSGLPGQLKGVFICSHQLELLPVPRGGSAGALVPSPSHRMSPMSFRPV